MLTAEVVAMIDGLRQRGTDHASVEAKRSRADIPADLWKSLVAFANQRGGVILLGVDEKSGFKVTGVDDAGGIEQRVAEVCCNDIEPPIRPTRLSPR